MVYGDLIAILSNRKKECFYSLTGSYGLALILFTLVVKLVILPFQLKGKKSMLRMSRMQGKIKEIQTRYANNKQRQQAEMADLYAREGVRRQLIWNSSRKAGEFAEYLWQACGK